MAIALAAVFWPPVARGDRAFAGIVWLGLLAGLLLVPSIGGVLNQLLGRGPQTLLPSVESAYPWLLALVATSVFAGLGIARRILGETALRRSRLVGGDGHRTRPDAGRREPVRRGGDRQRRRPARPAGAELAVRPDGRRCPAAGLRRDAADGDDRGARDAPVRGRRWPAGRIGRPDRRARRTGCPLGGRCRRERSPRPLRDRPVRHAGLGPGAARGLDPGRPGGRGRRARRRPGGDHGPRSGDPGDRREPRARIRGRRPRPALPGGRRRPDLPRRRSPRRAGSSATIRFGDGADSSTTGSSPTGSSGG